MSEEIQNLHDILLLGIDWPNVNEKPEVYEWRVQQIMALVGKWLEQHRKQTMDTIHSRSPNDMSAILYTPIVTFLDRTLIPETKPEEP